MARSDRISSWINVPILVGAVSFVLLLGVTAVFDPRLRLLHGLQALIYVAIVALTRRDSAWGFGAGCFVAAFWNYVNLFMTTFIRAGWQQLLILVQTGHSQRPDLLIAVIAAAGHFLIIIACLGGFLRLRPGLRLWVQFVIGGAIAMGYFALIIVTVGPQYIGLLKRAFHF